MLQAIDEPLDLIEYNRWNVFLPEGQFLTEVGNEQFEEVLKQVSPSGIPQWRVGTPSKPSCRSPSHPQPEGCSCPDKDGL